MAREAVVISCYAVGLPVSIESDLAAIARIGAVPTILKTIRESTGLRYTLIARVLPDRWVACAVHDEIEFGLGVGGELDVATTLCSVVRDTHEPVIIDEARTDPVYCGHPTPKMYGFESYIAVPIFRKNGEYFGNICGLDPLPNKLSDSKTLSMLRLFSELVSTQLEADEEHASSRAELDDQREATRLREQFIAVLGHDLRNPLSSITAGTELLLWSTKDQGERRTLERIRSSSRRIAALIDDVLDLARGRLGGGIGLELREAADLEARLSHVVAEVQSAHPSRSIELHSALSGPVRCDEKRMEQLLSNLLANAVEHGAAKTPINVRLSDREGRLSLEVENRGAAIPEEVRSRLFVPYFRAGQEARSGGLGLGLYIVSEIAKAHGGSIAVDSDDERTVFRVSLPGSPQGANT